MNNREIINAINEIVNPHFIFNIGGIHEDKWSLVFKNIEELNTLYFKLDGKKKSIISKNKQDELVEKIKNLNIGTVENIKVNGIGRFIVIDLYTENENEVVSL